jgi:formamidopyrimidine-DNA glycosylase
MRRGAREGRIITVRPRGVPVEGITEAEGRYVYKQERCRRCGSPVQTWELAGRIAYACPRDQPPTSGAVTGSG